MMQIEIKRYLDVWMCGCVDGPASAGDYASSICTVKKNRDDFVWKNIIDVEILIELQQAIT